MTSGLLLMDWMNVYLLVLTFYTILDEAEPMQGSGLGWGGLIVSERTGGREGGGGLRSGYNTYNIQHAPHYRTLPTRPDTPGQDYWSSCHVSSQSHLYKDNAMHTESYPDPLSHVEGVEEVSWYEGAKCPLCWWQLSWRPAAEDWPRSRWDVKPFSPPPPRDMWVCLHCRSLLSQNTISGSCRYTQNTPPLNPCLQSSPQTMSPWLKVLSQTCIHSQKLGKKFTRYLFWQKIF